jgi:DNA-binding GntR family transcriptional regulator
VTGKAVLRGSAKRRRTVVRPARIRAAEIDSLGSRKSQQDGALSRKAYQAILERIFAGRLFPGKVLSEVALARELGMSRTPVHSAIRELVKDGLVAQEKNRRPVISHFTRTDMQEIFEMRRLLEAEAAYRAASHIDRPTLVRLRNTGEALERHLAEPDILIRWANFDEEFHRAVAQACGNRRLAKDIERYQLIHRGLNTMRLTPELVPQALAEHMRILGALERRDPNQCRLATLEHIQEWQAYYIRFFSE